MELLIIIVNSGEYFETILSILVALGTSRATIFDSEGIGHFLAYNVPIFAGLRFMFAGSRSYNKTILSVIKEKKVLPLKKLVRKILGPLDKSGNGILFFIELSEVVGLKPEIK